MRLTMVHAALLAGALCAGCGGAAICSGAPAPEIQAPTAVGIGERALLEALVHDGDVTCQGPFAFFWSMTARPAGSQAALSDWTSSDPSFAPDLPGEYRLSLQVTDAQGRQGRATDVTVIAVDCTMDMTLWFSISPGRPRVGQPVEIAVTTYEGPVSGGCNPWDLHFDWSVVGAPIGSTVPPAYSLTRLLGVIPDLVGDYAIQLDVTDNYGNSARGAVPFFAGCGSDAGISARIIPTADGGGATVLLASVTDSANSTACGAAPVEPFAYAWTVTPPVGVPYAPDLTGPTVPAPTQAGQYLFTLVVTDAQQNRTQVLTYTFTAGAGTQ